MGRAKEPQARIVISVAVLASIVVFLDGSIVTIALPQLRAELGGGLTFQQWVVDAYTLTLAAFILIAGALSDALGRQRILKLGLLGFGVASLLCAMAPSAELLVAFRAAQGVSGALLVPSSLALIASHFRGSAQARAVGLWSAWTSAAFIAGPPLGGILVDTVGWRWVFGLNLPLVVITLLAVTRLNRESTPRSSPAPDVLGAMLAAVGLGGVVFALIEQERLGWRDALVQGFGAAGLVALVLFVLWERMAPAPMMPLGLFRARNFSVGNATTFLVWGALWLGVFIVPVFLQQVMELPGVLAGLATAPMTVISLLVSGSIGTLAGRWGAKWFIVIGPLVAAAGYGWMLTVSNPVNIWTGVVPGVVVAGTGIAIITTPITTAVLSAVPSGKAGIASAVNNAVARVAGLIAIALVGTLTGAHLDVDGFHRVLIAVIAFMVFGSGLAALLLRQDHPTAGASSPALPEQQPHVPLASSAPDGGEG